MMHDIAPEKFEKVLLEAEAFYKNIGEIKCPYLRENVIHQSHTLQGILFTKGFEYEKIHSRWDTTLRNVTYYEFVSVIKERTRVRVIVKQVESGPRYFWSIIPFWKQNTVTHRRNLHSGKPEED